MFTVSISTNGAAFEGNTEQEIARILRELAEKIEREGCPDVDNYPLRDTNGNKVGAAWGGRDD